MEAAERALQGSRVLAIADEAVGESERVAIGGAAAADSDVSPTRSTFVLHRAQRPGLDDLDHGVAPIMFRRERTAPGHRARSAPDGVGQGPTS
jgi:hypothetical protein